MPIVATAVAAECTHLLTGDKRHFGRLYGETRQRDACPDAGAVRR